MLLELFMNASDLLSGQWSRQVVVAIATMFRSFPGAPPTMLLLTNRSRERYDCREEGHTDDVTTSFLLLVFRRGSLTKHVTALNYLEQQNTV